MAPGYGQYNNNYYDPVGSQANQSHGYSYQNQSAATSASQPTTSAAYGTSQYPTYSAPAYNTSQQYGSTTGGQQNNARTNTGASSSTTGGGAGGMNGLDSQASGHRSNTTQHNDGGAGSWDNPNFPSGYNTGLQSSSRSPSTTSPQYASSTPASTFGRHSYATPAQQTQNGSVNYSQQSYGQQNTAQNYIHAESSDSTRQADGSTQQHQSTTEPSRYASPLHAAQAQRQSRKQSHMPEQSQSSNHQTSPVVNAHAPLRIPEHRQASASVEPVNTTVDPSQVYDFRAEREKKAKIEAEKRRKIEAIEAAKKAEEARIADEQRKIDEATHQAEETKRRAEEQQVQEGKRRAEQAKRKADERTAAAKAEAARKKEEQRKARESKSAADTLASLATSSNVQESLNPQPAANDEEAEMRAMFQKMREFNSKNPAMLAKLWEEERRSHAAQPQTTQSPAAAQTVVPPKPNAPKNAPSSTPLSGSTSTPAQLTSFRHASTTGTAAVDSPVNSHSTNTQPSDTNVQPVNAPQANAHLWPPGKKGLLAEIAARWLHGVNPQRVVTTTEILRLLDMNPNYVQLCESLEATGLRFERAAFARELLRGIPAAGPSNQTSPKVTEASIMSDNGTIAQANGSAAPETVEPKPKRRRATKAEMEQRRSLGLVNGLNKQAKGKGVKVTDDGMVDYEMPSFSVSDNAQPGAYITHIPEQPTPSFDTNPGMSPHFATSNDYSRQPSLSMQPERRSVSGVQQGLPTPVGSAQPMEDVRPLSPPREPADKEEAARKRGFGNLVDLTAGDSDDDDLPPMKVMRALQGPRPGQHDQQHMQRAHQPNQQSHQQHMQQASGFSKFKLPTSSAPSPGNPRPPFQAPAISTTSHLYMQPNGSFGVAPAAGRPIGQTPGPAPMVKTPTMPSPALPPPKRKGPTNEQLQHERIRGRMVVEPIMRDRVARKSTYDSRTIARDILLATGRHPDMRPLNSHLNPMQKLLGDRGGMADQSGNKSDLATIKWDILDPDPPKKHSGHQGTEVKNGIVKSTEVDGGDADDEEDLSLAKHKPLPAQNGSVRGSASDIRDANANASGANNNNNPPKIPKKRGRPPRASLPNPGGFTSVNSPVQPASDRPSGTPRQRSSQPQSTPMSAPSGAVGYAAFRQYDENGKEIKKKGRPVGWRKNVHSREAQGLTPKKSFSAKPKPTQIPASQLQEPKYQVYKCRWLDCDAELHSLEVLKKHVTKVHGKPDLEAGDQYHCSWQGCKLHAKHFNAISSWLSHVDKEHLQPVAWQLGDGPRGGLSDHQDSELSEAYLSDAFGRSVTPIIRPMSNITMAETVMPARPGRPPAGSSKDERIAQQELQKLKERKMAVGPTMEKTGVRLANEKRRMGFLDDENFEDIVESEGEGPDDDDH